MGLNGEDIQSTRDKASASNTEVSEKSRALKFQMSERDKDLKRLCTQVKDNEDLTKQLNNLRSKYGRDTTGLTRKFAANRLNSVIDQSPSKARVRSNRAARGLLNMDETKLDDDSDLTGLDDQVKSLHKSDTYLFDDGAKQNYNPESGNPPASDTTQAMVDVFRGV